MKICQAVLKLWGGHENDNTQRAITPKVGKTRVRVHVFCMSSHGV